MPALTRRRLPGPPRRRRRRDAWRTAGRPAARPRSSSLNRSRPRRRRSTIPVGRLRARRDLARRALRRSAARRRAPCRSTGGPVAVSLPAMSALVLATGRPSTWRRRRPGRPARHRRGRRPVSRRLDRRRRAPPATTSTAAPLTGGGYVQANDARSPATSLHDTTASTTRQPTYYVVRALDAAGNASAPSNEVSGLPHLVDRLGEPPVAADDDPHDQRGRPDGQRLRPGLDRRRDQPARPDAEPASPSSASARTARDPAGNAAWTWVDAAFNTDAGNNDEFVASPAARGDGHVRLRLPLHDDERPRLGLRRPRRDRQRLLAGPGRRADGQRERRHDRPGRADRPARSRRPRRPASSSPGTPSPATPTLYGYEVLRGDAPGGPYATIALDDRRPTLHRHRRRPRARPTATSSARSTRRSTAPATSAEVAATAELRTVTLVFNVTVPATTDGTGRSVHIAGFLDRLDGGHPQWDPGGVVADPRRRDPLDDHVHRQGGDPDRVQVHARLWDYVEKDGACGEIANRQLTLSYGATGTQTVNDVVPTGGTSRPAGTEPDGLEEPDRRPVLVDVDAERRRRGAEAGHRLHVAAERDDPARAGVGAQVADREREPGRRARAPGRARATGASSPCRPAARRARRARAARACPRRAAGSRRPRRRRRARDRPIFCVERLASTVGEAELAGRSAAAAPPRRAPPRPRRRARRRR